MEIWVKFCKSKYMGNVGMGKFLKTLPITVCQYMGKYSTYGPTPLKNNAHGINKLGIYRGLIYSSKSEPCMRRSD